MCGIDFYQLNVTGTPLVYILTLAIPCLLAGLDNPCLHRFLKAESGMKQVQEQDGRNDDRTFKPNEVLLCVGQMAIPSLAKLGDTKHTPREDA